MTQAKAWEIVWDALTESLEKVVDELLSLIPEQEPLIYSVDVRGYFNLK